MRKVEPMQNSRSRTLLMIIALMRPLAAFAQGGGGGGGSGGGSAGGGGAGGASAGGTSAGGAAGGPTAGTGSAWVHQMPAQLAPAPPG
jgi:hypothetical protein